MKAGQAVLEALRAEGVEYTAQPATVVDEGAGIEVFDPPDRPGNGHGGTRRKHKKTVKVLRTPVIVGGPEEGVERRLPVDVPRFPLVGKDEFERPWHVALWAPNDPEVRQFMERLEGLGYFVEGSGINFSNSRGLWLYYLLFASRSSTGIDFWKKITERPPDAQMRLL